MGSQPEPQDPEQHLTAARRIALGGSVLTGFYVSFTTIVLLEANVSEILSLLATLVPGGLFMAWFSGYAYKELNPEFKGRLWEASMEFFGEGEKFDFGPARKIGIGRMAAGLLAGLFAAIIVALIIFG